MNDLIKIEKTVINSAEINSVNGGVITLKEITDLITVDISRGNK